MSDLTDRAYARLCEICQRYGCATAGDLVANRAAMAEVAQVYDEVRRDVMAMGDGEAMVAYFRSKTALKEIHGSR